MRVRKKKTMYISKSCWCFKVKHHFVLLCKFFFVFVFSSFFPPVNFINDFCSVLCLEARSCLIVLLIGEGGATGCK